MYVPYHRALYPGFPMFSNVSYENMGRPGYEVTIIYIYICTCIRVLTKTVSPMRHEELACRGNLLLTAENGLCNNILYPHHELSHVDPLPLKVPQQTTQAPFVTIVLHVGIMTTGWMCVCVGGGGSGGGGRGRAHV